MSKSLVSVIIPMYNASATIITALNSVINQTYNNFEIIVINDGSKDDGPAKVEAFILENQRPGISYTLINQKNAGVSAARNAGIKAASGDLLAMLDSDDEWLPSKIEKQLAVLDARTDVDFVGCNRNNEQLGFPYKEKDGLLEVKLTSLMFKMAPQTSTALIRQSAIASTGLYDEKQKYAEDGNLWLRLCTNHKMLILQESLVITGSGKRSFGTSGLSARLWEMEKGELKNFREMKAGGHINYFQFIFFSSYSLFKCLRRVIIVKLSR